MEARPAHHERSVNALATVQAPYETVAATFANFTQTNRGGIQREDKKAKSPRASIITASKDYIPQKELKKDITVQSSFTDEQRPYVQASIMVLNTLAQGRLVLDNEHELPRFAHRVEKHFIEQEEKKRNFMDAVQEATVDVYADFGTYYPNLIPALAAFSRIAGIDGTGLAIYSTRYLLHDALRGLFDHNTIKEHTTQFMEPDDFIGVHRTNDQSPDYEIQCAGVAFARTINREAKLAALTLANDETLQINYGQTYNDTDTTTNIKGQLRQLIADMHANERQE